MTEEDDIMSEALSLILFVALFFMGYHYEQKIKEKSERYQWILSEQGRFHRIAQDFEKQCKEYVRQYFPSHTGIICRYRKGSVPQYMLDELHYITNKLSDEIDTAKKDYIENFSVKYESHYDTFHPEAYPNYLFDEYESEIHKIANHYYDIVTLMRDQTYEMRSIPKE